MPTGTETVLKVVEPATEEILAEVPEADAEAADEAVARAKEAFPAWRALDCVPWDACMVRVA